MNRPLDHLRSIRNLALRRRSRRLPVLSYEQIEAAIQRLPAAVISKVLHQIWLGPKRPPLETMASCRQMNPGWQYVLWTEDNLPPMINRHVFDGFGSTYAAKADVLRYEVLFRFGGVYVDVDQLCLRSFDDLLVGNDAFFAGYQNFLNPELDGEQKGIRLVANAVLGAAARHPIIERIIQSIADTAAYRKLPAWLTVGPAAVTRVIEEIKVRAVIHPFHEFYPYHFTEHIPATPDQMLKAIHYQSHSVSLWGSTLGRYRCWRRMPGVKPGWKAENFAVSADFAATHPKLKPTVYCDTEDRPTLTRLHKTN